MPLPFSLARPLPRSPLRSADGHRNRDAIVPRYLHISAFPIGNRYSVADSVRSLQLPSAPPALRADARAARYESISPGTMTDTQLQWSARMPYCPDLIGTTSDEHLPCRRCRTRFRADRRHRRRRSNITHSILPKRTACRSVLFFFPGLS